MNIARSTEDNNNEKNNTEFKEFDWLETKGSPQTVRNALDFSKHHNNDPLTVKYAIRILARKRQSDLMAAIIRNGSDQTPSYGSHEFMFCGMPMNVTACRTDEKERVLDLAKDMLLPWPWSWGRYETLSYIGLDVGEPWEEDSNHSVEFFYPIEIGIVGGGNHSIATGIIKGEGKLTVRSSYDISPLYHLFQWDGDSFVCDGQRYPIQDFDMAAIIELGRLISNSQAKN